MKQLLFGKRTSKVQVAERPLPPLAMCLLMDMMGCASYIVPFFGELLDLVWAPISAIMYMKMFGVRKGFFGGIFSFIEELMPGLDIIPTFTITWFVQYNKRMKENVAVEPVRNKWF